MSPRFGGSWFFIPIVRQVQMHIHISTIKIVVSTQREPDILTNLPTHVIFVEFSLSVLVSSEIVCNWLRALKDH